MPLLKIRFRLYDWQKQERMRRERLARKLMLQMFSQYRAYNPNHIRGIEIRRRRIRRRRGRCNGWN
jgi:hypothetical protein